MKCEQYSDLSNYFAAMMERLPPESFARLHDPSEAKDSCLLFLGFISEMAIHCDEKEIHTPAGNLAHITITLAELAQVLEEVGLRRQKALGKG